MNKRAFEIQIHWIFILIAGAVILAFFFSVVSKQQVLSEQKLSITLSYQMDAVFAGAIESKGTTQPLVTPMPGIAFSCTNVCDCNFHIGKKATEFQDKLIFAPSMIKDFDAWAWTIDWKLPFRVTNFLMLTNPRIKYYFIHDSNNQDSVQLYQRLIKEIPTEINQQTIESSYVTSVSHDGSAHTRFVFIGTSPQAVKLHLLHTSFEEEDVSAVWIAPDLSRVVYHEKRDPDELEFNQYDLPLAGDATAYASIFAADHQMYDCMMQRAFGKLQSVAFMHNERAGLLQQEMEALQRFDCQYIREDLKSVEDAARVLTNMATLRSPEIDEPLRTIRNIRHELKRQNDVLVKQNCPELY